MTSRHDGARTPGSPGGHTAAGATPQGEADVTGATGSGAAAEPVPSSLHDLEEAVPQLEHDAEHRPPPAGTVTNVVVALVVVAIGAAAFVGSLSLGAGTARQPGSHGTPM